MKELLPAERIFPRIIDGNLEFANVRPLADLHRDSVGPPQ